MSWLVGWVVGQVKSHLGMEVTSNHRLRFQADSGTSDARTVDQEVSTSNFTQILPTFFSLSDSVGSLLALFGWTTEMQWKLSLAVFESENELGDLSLFLEMGFLGASSGAAHSLLIVGGGGVTQVQKKSMTSKRKNPKVSRDDGDTANDAACEGRGSFSQHVTMNIVIGLQWLSLLGSKVSSMTSQDWGHYPSHTRHLSGLIPSIFLNRPSCSNDTAQGASSRHSTSCSCLYFLHS